MIKLREKKVSIKSLIDNYVDNWKKDICNSYRNIGLITFIDGERLVIAICHRAGQFEKEMIASLNFEMDI